MATIQDKVATTDEALAEVFADYISSSSSPLYPCPKCGKETKEHHEKVERHPETRKILDRQPVRICCMKDCRTELVGEEAIAEAYAKGQAEQHRVAACAKCGKATKEHHPDEETGDPRRICSSTDCRHIQPA